MLSLMLEGTLLIRRITSKLLVLHCFLKKLYSDCYSRSQDETSEAFIGEWAETRGIRDQLVIATKVHKFLSFVTKLDH